MSTRSELGLQRYREQYTLLPSQLIFKIERMSAYDRNELIKKSQLERELQLRRESCGEAREAGLNALPLDPSQPDTAAFLGPPELAGDCEDHTAGGACEDQQDSCPFSLFANERTGRQKRLSFMGQMRRPVEPTGS